jgi:quinol-cytochrome oxidoreductase complex cytochrome b subunit
MVAVVNNLILHLHPTTVPAQAVRFSYTWGLGGISALLASLLAVTGLMLMFRYDASVDRAYLSIQILETQVPFGSLFRAVHHWSANLLVVTAFLHLLRVFMTGGFKKGRSMNWLVGTGLLLIVLAFNFTGYLLPWDQLAYWAITVSTSLLGYIPLVGQAISHLFLAGPTVGQGSLRNFYALHVALLPALLVLTLAYHFWKVRKSGGISQPLRTDGQPVERVTTIPNLVQVEMAVATIVLVGVLLFSMLTPAPLGDLANPANSPNPAKAAWYFLGLQEILLHMHPLAAIVLVAIVLAGLIAVPFIDRKDDNIGIYFRSPTGRRTVLVGALTALYLIPALVVVDEFWLDLSALLPSFPTFISNGLIPLALALAGFGAIYLLNRSLLKANHSEALAGLVAFILSSLIVLTLIGNFFRGANMALVLPF